MRGQSVTGLESTPTRLPVSTEHKQSYLVYFKVAFPEGSPRGPTQEGLRKLAVWKPPVHSMQMPFTQGKLYKSTKGQSPKGLPAVLSMALKHALLSFASWCIYWLIGNHYKIYTY